jgi:hypothetical protein
MSVQFVVILPILLLIVGSLVTYFTPAGVRFRKAAFVLIIVGLLPVIWIAADIWLMPGTFTTLNPDYSATRQAPTATPLEYISTLPADNQTKPPWVGTPPQSLTDAYQTTVVVGPFTTREECEAQLPDAIQAALDNYVALCLGEKPAGRIAIAPDELRCLVKEQWTELGQYSVGPMVRLHALLRFDLKFKERVLEEYKRLIISRRLYAAGGGWLTAMAVLAAVYFGLKRRGMRD